MHHIFVVRGFMRQLDPLSYKIGVHTDWEVSVRVCEELEYLVISCLIIRLSMPLFSGRSPDWLGEPH